MRNRFVTLTLALASPIAVVSFTPARIAGQAPEGRCQAVYAAAHARRSSGPARHLRPRHADAAGPPSRSQGDPHHRGSGQAGERRRRSERGAATGPSRPIGTRRPKAATDRSARRETSAATTRSGSIRARRYTIVNGERRTSLIVDPPDGRVPPMTPAPAAARWPRAWRGRRRTRRRAATPGSKRRAPTTIPSGVRSASAACWGLARRPDRRRFRTTSTTTSTRSCRRRTR